MQSNGADLLWEWANWSSSSLPFILEADRAILDSTQRSPAFVTFHNWREAYGAPDFCAPKDHRLHLGLLPQPFFGNLRRASIYVLLLNPGLGPHDYFGEYEVPEYRRALLANLRQDFGTGLEPFLFLNPRYSWHGGFGWWHGKLSGVIDTLAKSWSVPFSEARDRLARELASIELVPYHSSSFRNTRGLLRGLQSVALARAYVHDVVLPRVRRGKAIVIVTRQASVWNLPKHSGIVRYSGQQARAAHLSPNSPGGKAILKHMMRKRRTG